MTYITIDQAAQALSVTAAEFMLIAGQHLRVDSEAVKAIFSDRLESSLKPAVVTPPGYIAPGAPKRAPKGAPKRTPEEDRARKAAWQRGYEQRRALLRVPGKPK